MESYYLVDREFLREIFNKMNYLKMFNDKLTENDYLESLIFCNKLVQNHDPIHNLCHHILVLNNALTIAAPHISGQLDKNSYFTAFLFYVCIFHDVLNRKYTYQLESRKKYLTDFLRQKIGTQSPKVLWIMDNLSLAKEKITGYPTHPDKTIQLIRDICSDANRLESLGQIGLDRFYFYQKLMFPTLNHEVIVKKMVDHCLTNLIFVKDYHLYTAIGKKMAEPLHNIILNFVDCNR